MTPSRLNTNNLPAAYSASASSSFKKSPFDKLNHDVAQSILDRARLVEPTNSSRGYYAFSEAYPDMREACIYNQQSHVRQVVSMQAPELARSIGLTNAISPQAQRLAPEFALGAASPESPIPRDLMTPELMDSFSNIRIRNDENNSHSLLDFLVKQGVQFSKQEIVALSQRSEPELKSFASLKLRSSMYSKEMSMREILNLQNSNQCPAEFKNEAQSYINTGLQQNTLSSQDCFDIILSKKSSENQIRWANHNLSIHISEGRVNKDSDMVFTLLNHIVNDPKFGRKPSDISSLMAKTFKDEIPRIQDSDLLVKISRLTMHKELSAAARSQYAALR